MAKTAIAHGNQSTNRKTSGNRYPGLGDWLSDSRAVFLRNFTRWLDAWIAVDDANRSDAAFARAIGVSAATVADYRHGRSAPEVAKLGRIADELGINLWQLFDDPNETRPAPRLPLDPREEALRVLFGDDFDIKRRKKRPRTDA